MPITLDQISNWEALGCILWNYTYIDLLLRNGREKTYGMPLAGICLNLAWEFIYSTIHPLKAPWSPHHFVSISWFFIDCGMMYQTVKYGRKEWEHVPFVRNNLGLIAGTGVIASFFLITGFVLDYEPLGVDTGIITGYLVNITLSISFIAMLFNRKSLRGQSLGIAVSKFLGTGNIIVAWWTKAVLWPEEFGLATTRSMIVLAVLILVFDCIYVGLVASIKYEKGDGVVSKWIGLQAAAKQTEGSGEGESAHIKKAA
ncbi:hypothetical protein HDV00_012830 [Rhizophlyctis rosea]|nr:hypothetical protein HDV00_012830 [Rhizophlyctis rosea]